MSRPYNPDCALERSIVERFEATGHSRTGLCRAGFDGHSCTAPRGHPGHVHVATSGWGRIVHARWTDRGKRQL